MTYENKMRSVIKAISWRFFATLQTALIVWVITGEIKLAVSAGVIDVIIKIISYFIHERVWNSVKYGRTDRPSFVLWFTGLSGAGKTTIATEVYHELQKEEYKVEYLDGDVIRSIFPQTGFTKEERNRHLGRVSYLASTLSKNGISVIAAFISPYKESRKFARSLCENFIEVYLSTPVEECEKRDVKGLYKKARDGKIKHFTGINDPYEEPENPEIVIDTSSKNLFESKKVVIDYLKQKELI
ncbi:MAG: adenylyl-sulfate kinase [Spirochaetia bacterium]|nr:adenylyl-sulfate kinase [Spirochaetia bacterium]